MLLKRQKPQPDTTWILLVKIFQMLRAVAPSSASFLHGETNSSLSLCAIWLTVDPQQRSQN